VEPIIYECEGLEKIIVNIAISLMVLVLMINTNGCHAVLYYDLCFWEVQGQYDCNDYKECEWVEVQLYESKYGFCFSKNRPCDSVLIVRGSAFSYFYFICICNCLLMNS
jgi:hypothetical protein